MKKRNEATKKYEEYNVPTDWNCPLIVLDMEEQINCVSCGKVEWYGNCYTSKLIHNGIWLWHLVCQECYDKELRESYLSRLSENDN